MYVLVSIILAILVWVVVTTKTQEKKVEYITNTEYIEVEKYITVIDNENKSVKEFMLDVEYVP